MLCGGHKPRYMRTGHMVIPRCWPMQSTSGLMSPVITEAEAEASAGEQLNKVFAIKSTCGGATMAGGVFWRPTTDDQAVNSITTGLHITLSDFLAEYTKNATYTAAAISSANWIKAQNLNTNNLVLDTASNSIRLEPMQIYLSTYNAGKYIEGLNALAAVTGDSQWTTLTLIHSYDDVQYNALIDLVATGSTYSSNWHGPPQAFTSWGQLAALDVMTSNIDTN
ncbi:hypothetical protein DFH09DRAFT_1313876 [Mycena vulgaris]|nr:hypothetical protein DFH09DRAFT_1313876 [Mycena vulgaris]